MSCELKDQPSCPRISPTKLTTSELTKIKDIYTSKDFAHYSVLSLSWLGKKTGQVIASASTWSRVIRELGLKRNRVRIYPSKPKVGVRASTPGEIWHLDLSILRRQDGTRAFVQAVIDNFSRYVLAWKVSRDYGGLRTKELILKAIAKAHSLIPLTSFEGVESGADYYFTQSNTHIPMAVLKGATPEEVVTGKWTDQVIAGMQMLVKSARTARIEFNRSMRCTPCLG